VLLSRILRLLHNVNFYTKVLLRQLLTMYYCAYMNNCSEQNRLQEQQVLHPVLFVMMSLIVISIWPRRTATLYVTLMQMMLALCFLVMKRSLLREKLIWLGMCIKIHPAQHICIYLPYIRSYHLYKLPECLKLCGVYLSAC
jgi:cell division protein FtsW (lipid II flippase)